MTVYDESLQRKLKQDHAQLSAEKAIILGAAQINSTESTRETNDLTEDIRKMEELTGEHQAKKKQSVNIQYPMKGSAATMQLGNKGSYGS